MNGTTLSGTWRQGARRGNIRFDFSNDFSSFEAWWGENDGPLTNAWGRAVRIDGGSSTIYCLNLFHLGVLIGNLEMGAYEGYNYTWMTNTIDYAIQQARASNCVSLTYLTDLRRRIQGYSNTSSFSEEIKSYRARLIAEIETSCSCCLSCNM